MSDDDLQIEMSIEDEFSDLTADLLSDTRYEPVLVRLFKRNPGSWLAAASLISKVDDELAKRLNTLENAADGTLRVAWIEYQESEHGIGYCTVVFFMESIFWSSVAVYHKDRLLRDHKVRLKKAASAH